MRKLLLLVILVIPFVNFSQIENRHKISLEYSLIATKNQLRIYSIEYEVDTFGMNTSIDQSKTITQLNTVFKLKPIQLQYDYFLNEKSSINLSFNVSSYSSSGFKIDSIWNPNLLTYNVSEKKLDYGMFRTKILFGYMRHFRLKNDRFTLFGLVKLGYSINKQYYSENNIEKDVDNSIFAVAGNTLNGMFAFGVNYKIIPKLEFSSSIGVGGSVLSFGLRKSF